MSPAREEVGLGPDDAYFADERLQPLIGPGAPFEVEPLVLEEFPCAPSSARRGPSSTSSRCRPHMRPSIISCSKMNG